MGKNSFFKTLASAFVEVKEDENVNENAVVNPTQGKAAPQTATKPIVQPSVSSSVIQPQSIENVNPDGSIQGQLDSKLFEKLCDVLEESNIPGPDYIELTKAAQNDVMKSAIPDEKARYMAAYISMKTNAPQLTRDIVLKSIDTYVNILEGERKNGLDELKVKWTETVDKPQKEVDKAQKEIVSLQKQLQDKIKFVAEQNTAIVNAKNDCNIKKANFNYTFDVFEKKLTDDKAKLDAVLQD